MKTIYKLQTLSTTYYFYQNLDGTLTLTKWGVPAEHAGKIIKNMGGIVAFMQRAEPTGYSSFDEVREDRERELDMIKKRKAERFAQWAADAQSAYKELVCMYPDEIPVTIGNLRIVLAYLHSQESWNWHLPDLSVGYSADQYDCDGRRLTAIRLDAPIECRGRMISKFKYGFRTFVYLPRYKNIERL